MTSVALSHVPVAGTTSRLVPSTGSTGGRGQHRVHGFAIAVGSTLLLWGGIAGAVVTLIGLR